MPACAQVLHFSRGVKFNRSSESRDGHLKRAVIQLALLPIVIGLLIATTAFAQTSVTLVPSLTTSSVYDDNVFAEQQGSAGQMLQLRPSVEGNWESPRLTFLSLYSFDMIRSNHADLNDLDARRHGFFDTRFRRSPFTTWGIAARYDRTDTPGELNIETGILTERRTAQRWQVTPTLVRRFGPRMVFSAGYDYTTENLVDTPSGTLQTGRLGLAREVSPYTTIGASYLARYFEEPHMAPPLLVTSDGEFESSTTLAPPSLVPPVQSHTSQALLATFDRELGPSTHLSLQAGPRVSSYSGLSSEVSGTFMRLTRRLQLALNYWHGETIILGIPGPVRMDGGMARVTWPFTHRIDLGVHAGISDIETLDAREARVYRTTLIGSWTRGMYSLTADYGLDFQQGDIRRRLDDDVLRHVFRVSLTVAPRLNRSILPPEEAARVKGVTR